MYQDRQLDYRHVRPHPRSRRLSPPSVGPHSALSFAPLLHGHRVTTPRAPRVRCLRSRLASYLALNPAVSPCPSPQVVVADIEGKCGRADVRGLPDDGSPAHPAAELLVKWDHLEARAHATEYTVRCCVRVWFCSVGASRFRVSKGRGVLRLGNLGECSVFPRAGEDAGGELAGPPACEGVLGRAGAGGARRHSDALLAYRREEGMWDWVGQVLRC